MGKIAYDPDLGKKFGKSDLERLGIFVEMPYMLGARHADKRIYPEARKGPTMLNTGTKSRNGTQSGYFEKEYKRLFEGEAITRKKPGGQSDKALAPFLVGARTKRHSTPGDYHGTFTKHDAFSPVLRPKKENPPESMNFVTKNGKQGGPGYANICLNPYPEHSADRYGQEPVYKVYGVDLGGPFVSCRYPKDYFEDKPFQESPDGNAGPCYVKRDAPEKPLLAGHWVPIGPTKWQGGCHGGCLNPFPVGGPDKYVSSTDANKYVSVPGPVTFYPNYTEDKTMFTSSVMARGVDIRVNADNYKNAEPNYNKYLLN